MTSRNRLSLAFVCVAGFLVLGESCLPHTPAKPVATTGTASTTAKPTPGRPQADAESDAQGSISVSLSAPGLSDAKVVSTELSANETQTLLTRLEPLPNLAAQNAHAPSMRAPTAAPEPAGGIHPIGFAAPSGKAVANAPRSAASVSAKEPSAIAPLAAPEIRPEGDVAHESEIRVRFAEPMVPVAKVGIAEKVPVTVVPKCAGTWRWIDTRVLTFTSDSRFPGATDFMVTVPAGARALSGATLANDAKTKFSTSPIEISGRFPHDTLRPDSPILVEFNQSVDEHSILPFLHVKTKNNQRLAVGVTAFARAEELWKKNPSITVPYIGDMPRVILTPATEWPADSEIVVVLDKGAPSKEGPRVSVREGVVTFRIAPAFKLVGISCEDMEKSRMNGAVCPAFRYLNVDFSNPISPDSFRAKKVQIEGEAFEDVSSSGIRVSLHAPSTPGREHRVVVDRDLVDVYGQSLVGARFASFTTSAQRFDGYLEAPSGLHVLDPRFEIPQWVITAEAVSSVRIRLFRVGPQDYFAFKNYEAGSLSIPPGRCVYDKTTTVGPHSGANIRVDLRPALETAGVGHVIAIATAEPYVKGARKDDSNTRVAWIQVTKLGLTARIDGEKVSGWIQKVSPARFLEPVAGAKASLLVEGRPGLALSAISDSAGHATFDLAPPTKSPEATALLLAQSGTDSTFTAIESHERAIREQSALWYVTDDRFVYKPGEKVYVKGWVRFTHNGANPNLTLPAAGDGVSFVLEDSRAVKLASGKATLSDQGGFDLAVTLPENANLGHASFRLSSKHGEISHPISIQEFRKPAFAVTLNDDVLHAGALPLVAGESIKMRASASYYSGGGLAGSSVSWNATLKAAYYRPPGWESYFFIQPHPRQADDGYYSGETEGVGVHAEGQLSNESSGDAVFTIRAIPLRRPSLLNVDATVTDVDRMTIRASSRSILVHPSSYYVGIRQQPGESDVLEFIVTDVEGNAIPDVPIKVRFEGVLGSERYRADAKVVDRQSCNPSSSITPVVCRLTRIDDKTAYVAMATIADPRGRTNASQYAIPWYRADKGDKDFSVDPDKTLYRVGETAKLDIHSAVVPATAVVTVDRQGIAKQKRVELTQASTIVELPILPEYVENLHISVDRLAKKRQEKSAEGPPFPETVWADADIKVDVSSARLDMKTRATSPLVGPGEKATFEVQVQHDGKPQRNAEVALMVVDEAILALSGKSHEDPLKPFYSWVFPGTTYASNVELMWDSGNDLKGNPGIELYDLGGEGGGGRGEGIGLGSIGTLGHGAGSGVGELVSRSSSVVSRKDFRATAAFSPLLKTDADGRALLTVTMPDSLTRFRIVALATARGWLFGKAEGTIVTQRKVNARAVAPRFLTQGDRFSLPVVVQNLGTQARTVDVAVRAANLTLKSPLGQRVTLPAGERAEVRFDFATQARGRSVIQTIVSSGEFADASNVEVPVYEPATTESFATYGVVDEKPEFEQLAVPKTLYQDVGGVEVQLASSQLQSLTDAYWYLYAYPYECAEQRSARMLATTAVYDILDAFVTPGRPTRSEIDTMRQKDVLTLSKDQQKDGGWGYFRGMHSDPYVTMQVLQALAAQNVEGMTTKKAVEYVDNRAKALVSSLDEADNKGSQKLWDDGEQAYRVSLAAWALTTLASANVSVQDRAEHLHTVAVDLGAYPVDAKARLLSIVAKQQRFEAMRSKLLSELLSVTHETASSATVAIGYKDAERLLLPSNNKTTALVLDALLREKPDHPLITKLARGVLDGRRHGRWSSTQENLVALQALRRYFDTFEKATPDFSGKLWFGTAAYAEQSFVGRKNTVGQAQLDWQSLVPGSTHDLALVKAGVGRMYYRVGITYAPKDEHLPALDAGFIVRRQYEALEKPSDVQELADGRWKVRLGAKALVRLEVLNTTRRYNVALVDPLPAGFETVNEHLATSERAAPASHSSHWDFENMRDNRSEAFAMSLPEGGHVYAYTVRATTPGTYTAAPAKAEEMYSPETFGRSSGEVVVVE